MCGHRALGSCWHSDCGPCICNLLENSISKHQNEIPFFYIILNSIELKYGETAKSAALEIYFFTHVCPLLSAVGTYRCSRVPASWGRGACCDTDCSKLVCWSFSSSIYAVHPSPAPVGERVKNEQVCLKEKTHSDVIVVGVHHHW